MGNNKQIIITIAIVKKCMDKDEKLMSKQKMKSGLLKVGFEAGLQCFIGRHSFMGLLVFYTMPETKAMSVLRERPDGTIVLMFKLRLLHGHATQLLFQCRDKTGINLFCPFINHHLHLYECSLNEKHSTFSFNSCSVPPPPPKKNAFVQTKKKNFLLCQSSCFTRTDV